MSYSRYAVYYVPPEGDLARFGAAWLGWDVARARPVAQPKLRGLGDITVTPRKYGFHGTLKPPFRMRAGRSVPELERAAAQMAASLAPAVCEGLAPMLLGNFVALTPFGDTAALRHVAATCVRDLDGFREDPDASELARRRKSGLTERQDALLMEWGYPYVMEEFRFHLTLSGKLPPETRSAWLKTVQAQLPELPTPFIVDQIALCGEREDGQFELIHRYTLAG